MGVLTIELGGLPHKGGSAGKPKGLVHEALRDYMKSKGKDMPEEEEGEGEEVSAAEEAGKAAAEDFGNAKDGAERWDAFKRMCRAERECAEGSDDASESEGDEGDSKGEEY